MQHQNIAIEHKSSCTLETYDYIHQNVKVHFIMLQRCVHKFYTQWWFQEGWDYHTLRLLNNKSIIVILKATLIFATMVTPWFATTWFASSLKATTPLGCVVSLKAPIGIRIRNKFEGNNGLCKKLESNKFKGDGNYSLDLLFINAYPLAILKLNACQSSNLVERLNHFNENEGNNGNKFER